MTTTADLTARAAELVAAGVPFVHATVVRAERPASVGAGASALVHADGRIEGFVGGSCAESSVQVHSLAALAAGEPVLLRIMPGVAGTEVPDGRVQEGAVTVRNPCLSGGALEIFLEPHRPPPRLVVFGSTPVGRTLARLGTELQYAVAHDGEPAPGDAAVVVASHGHDEERILESALRAEVPYVALVASRRRGEAVVASLDVPEELRRRVRTPAGLPIGARTAAEVAVSILAEIVSLRPVPAGAASAEAATPRASAVDPVCGMTVAVGPDALSVVREGERVFFCSEGCRAAFA